MATTERGLGTPEFDRVVAAVRQGCNVLMLGEAGSGVEFPQALYAYFAGEFNAAIACYKGSGKLFFQRMAKDLDIPTTNGDDKPLTMDAQKEELLANVGTDTLLILPEAKRLSASIRYWLEDAIAAGVRVVCFASANPGRDIFLDMVEVELALPSDGEIRRVMEAEAQAQGLQLSRSELAELQPLAGRNPMLARKVVRQRRLGLTQPRPEHTQYIVVMPIVVACLMAFGIVRFVGMGTQNKSLYILGGATLVAGMTLKQLGSVRGARKRLGQ
jgi:hypothetical protein